MIPGVDAERGSRDPALLRGRGPDLGPVSTRFPTEQRTLLHLLRAQADERGDRTWIVIDGRERLTYGGAQDAVNRVAHALVDSVGPDGHVALMLGNQIEFMPAFLGAMAAGGAAVPLNAQARGPLLEYVIAQSDATALVVRDDLIDRVRELDSLGAVRVVVVCGSDADADAVPIRGVPVVRWEDWLADRPTTTPARSPPGGIPG